MNQTRLSPLTGNTLNGRGWAGDLLRWSFGIALAAAAALVRADEQDAPHAKGLRPITAHEEAGILRNWRKVDHVKPNGLGLQRLTRERARRGWPALMAEGTASLAEEVAASLPAQVDNSALAWFPQVRSQGSIGSCVAWATTYYQLTHMAGAQLGWSNKTSDNAIKFSPKWTYNLINGGVDGGSTFSSAYSVLAKHGAAKWSEFPYDANYRAWCLNGEVWGSAIPFRARVSYIYSVSSTGLDTLKQLLNNGEVVVFGTYITSWQYKTASNDPSTAEDDALAGKAVAYWLNGSQGAHAMTFVGYCDSIWTDINGNGVVEAGEKGALRIANSWGTGWREAGFSWLAYDALRATSAVPGAPSVGRVRALQSDMAFQLTVDTSYTPTLLAEFTVNHAKRNQLRMSLGVSDITQSAPSTTWYPGAVSFQGGAYAFDGTTTPVDGTFVFDFTDIAPAQSGNYRFHLGLYDSALADIATVRSYSLVDLNTGVVERVCAAVPRTADAGQAYASVDHAYGNGNLPPVASARATPSSGQAPVTVAFDGSASYDPDGQIASYAWDFGDGSSGSGAMPTHVYANPGAYTATLTVTDNRGAQHAASVPVSVTQDPAKVVSVSAIDLSVTIANRSNAAKAIVRIVDAAGSPIAGATVTGAWDGLVKGTATGTTDASGVAAFISKTTTKRGTITFAVTGVAKSGYRYDSLLNAETSDAVTIP